MDTEAVKTLGLAADHAGYEFKESLLIRLGAIKGLTLRDFSALIRDPEDDYPDVVIPLSYAVARGELERGLAICGSGIGASIVANKVPNVRAAVIHDTYAVRKAVEEDNLNLLCLGANLVGTELAWAIVQIFLHSSFSNESRHRRRLDKIAHLEEGREIVASVH